LSGDEVFLRHIADAIARIESYVSVGRDVFLQTPHWQDAVIRQLEVVGEAAKRLSEELRANNADVPWRRVAGLRDVLIHQYMGVDISAVWEVTQQGLPELKKHVERILAGMKDR
jgi:uncharacterized protein with HEPN domain